MNDFIKNGFIIKKDLFKVMDMDYYINEFDMIVDQLKKSDENINARWGSGLTSDIEADDSLVIHTHNVQNYSSLMPIIILLLANLAKSSLCVAMITAQLFSLVYLMK